MPVKKSRMTCLTAEQSLGSGREVEDDGRDVEDDEGREGAVSADVCDEGCVEDGGGLVGGRGVDGEVDGACTEGGTCDGA